jgi:hypothetical protein
MLLYRQPPTWPRLEPLEPRLLLAATIVFSDGFEGAFPGAWVVTTNNPSLKWGNNGVMAAAGTHSAFCREDGTQQADTYVNNLTTTMERRSVSLAAYTSAALVFQYWLSSESRYDFFRVKVKSQSGTWSEVFSDSGDSSSLGWQKKTPGSGRPALTISA